MLRRSPVALPIRVRIALVYGVFLAITIVVVGISVVGLLRAELLREVDDSLLLRADRISRDVSAAGGGVLTSDTARLALADLPESEALSAPGLYEVVLRPDGTKLASVGNVPDRLPVSIQPLMDDAISGRSSYGNIPVEGDWVRLFAQPVYVSRTIVAVVLVGRSLHMVDLTTHQSEQLVAVATVLAVALSMVGGWILTGRTLGPVSDVTRVARSIARTGRFEEQIPMPPAHDELGELVTTFNDMIDRVADTVQRQREFLADASHELRSPLTVIRGNLDLLSSEISPTERELSIRVATREVDRMSRLVSDLLFLAEVDAREMIQREEVELDKLLTTVYQRAVRLDGRTHRLTIEFSEPVVVFGDGARLEQMIWNLVENALRYTPTDGKIALSLRRRADLAELVVADTGIGIPPEHVPRIFERFYRVDRARSRARGGSGLGLAIVRQIAEAHQASVFVQSDVGSGTTFLIRLAVVSGKPRGPRGNGDGALDPEHASGGQYAT